MTVPAQTPNIGLNFGWETGDDDWGGPVNWNWLLLDVVSVPFAKSITLTVPPTSPEEGDRYIIPTGATGVWANKVGRIAYFASGQWLYFQPKKGWYQRVFDTHKTYVWNGVEWEYYLDSITPEMMAQINAAVAAGEDAVEAAASTAADRSAVHEDRLAVDAARQAVDTAAAQVSSDKSAAVSAKNTAVAAAGDAAASKQSASESAVIAVQKAQEAAASAGSASTSATNAATSAGQAATARDAAVTAKTDLFNRYYGPLSADPATRPDGNPVQAGDEYTNTTTGKRRYYNGAAWDNLTGVASADLAAVDGASLVGAATYAQLRAYTGSATRMQVGGRTNYFDGAHGLFVRTGSAADNDGTIIVDALGRSWVRQFSGPVDVRWWGANIVDDATTAIQAAINSLADRGEVLLSAMFITSSPLTIPRNKFIKLQGVGQKASGITNNTTDVFTVDREWSVTFADMSLTAGPSAGHIFSFVTKQTGASYAGISGSRFENLEITVQNPTKCVMQSNNVDGIYIDNIWDNFYIYGVVNKTAHHFDFRETGGRVGANKWHRGRITWGKVQAFRFESLSANTYLYDNKLEHINFEILNGGIVKGIGVMNLTIDECWVYDVTSTGGVLEDHLVYLGKSGAGALSRFVNIKNSGRRSTNLGSGIVDVYCETGGVSGLQIENSAPATVSGFSVELNSTPNVVLVNLPKSSIINGVTSQTTMIFGGEVYIGTPYDGTKGSSLSLYGGISFPAAQNSSTDPNTLDDYREGSFTATETGVSDATAPTGSVFYVRVGNMVTLSIPTISGTSNTTACTLTGMPSAIRPTAQRTCLARIENNGVVGVGMARVETNGTITLFSSVSGGTFTASGTKGTSAFQMSYIV